MNTYRIRIALASAVVAAGLLAGCGGGGGTDHATDSSSSSSTTTTPPVDSKAAVVATANVSSLDVFAGQADTEPAQQLGSLPDYPLALLVVGNGDDADRVQVALPTRPNGSTGWVRRSDVTLAQHPYRLHIDLSDHKLTAYDGDRVALATTVAVGTAETPSPTGRFYITELVQPPDPNGAYGPYVFALSAHSEVLDQFGGGDGQVGIHGTNQPELLGSDVSHGCIRMANADILELTELLPLGTPVEIVQ